MAVGAQVPMTLPSALVMTTTDGRGGMSSRKSGERVGTYILDVPIYEMP
jgi:hypothetical protein